MKTTQWTRWLFIPFFLYGLYFVPMNLVLLTRAILLLISEGDGESFNIHYRFAWTWHPRSIELSRLELNGTDANVFWKINIDRVSFRPVFWNLFDRELRVKKLSGEDVQVRITPHSPERKAEYRTTHPDQDDDDQKSKDPFRVHIGQIELFPVRFIQTGSIRFEGQSRITGEFSLTPGTRLAIPSSAWEIQSGSILAQEHTLLEKIQATTSVIIRPTDLKHESGSQIFKFTDISHELRAKMLHAQVLGAAFSTYRPLVFGQSDGTLLSKLEIKNGVIQPRSQVSAELRATEIVWAGASLRGTGNLNWNVVSNEKTGTHEALLNFQLRDVLWSGQSTPSQPVPAPLMSSDSGLSITGRTRELSLIEPFGDLELAVLISHARIHSLSGLFRHLLKKNEASPVEFRSEKSEIKLRGTIRPSLGAFQGELTFRAPDFLFTHDSGKTRLKSALQTEVRFSSTRYEQGDFDLDTIQLKLEKIRIIQQGETEYSRDRWNLSWAFEPGTFRTRPEFQLRGTARLTLSDLALPLRYLAPDNFWIPIGLSVYPMKRFAARIELNADGNGASIKRLYAQTSSGAIDGSAHLLGADSQARFYLGLFPLNLCFEKPKLKSLQVSVTPSRERCLSDEEEKRISP